jgi:archaemetzincin
VAFNWNRSQRANVSDIIVVPTGGVTAGLPAWLSKELARELSREVRVAGPIELDAAWVDVGRDQFRGSSILEALGRLGSGSQEHLLGLVDADCFAEGLNFVFGEASPPGRVAFVALPRLRPSFYGEPRNDQLFGERVLKEALHELGHTWGLGHCPDPLCVMHFSNRLRDTDTKSASFCERCAAGGRAVTFGLRTSV